MKLKKKLLLNLETQILFLSYLWGMVRNPETQNPDRPKSRNSNPEIQNLDRFKILTGQNPENIFYLITT
jgi:hypothetical protein